MVSGTRPVPVIAIGADPCWGKRPLMPRRYAMARFGCSSVADVIAVTTEGRTLFEIAVEAARPDDLDSVDEV